MMGPVSNRTPFCEVLLNSSIYLSPWHCALIVVKSHTCVIIIGAAEAAQSYQVLWNTYPGNLVSLRNMVITGNLNDAPTWTCQAPTRFSFQQLCSVWPGSELCAWGEGVSYSVGLFLFLPARVCEQCPGLGLMKIYPNVLTDVSTLRYASIQICMQYHGSFSHLVQHLCHL